jgi:photosystem II stability/assembly factor-like uncharacterized protein
MFRLLIACAAALSTAADAAPRWEVRYFHDEDRSRLRLFDLKFCSAERALATGVHVRENDTSPVVLVTRDAGRNWQMVELREPGQALFCLDESHIWMVGPTGIWFSDEGGLSWRKIRSERGLAHVYFISPERGWAVGSPKLIIETRDGGKSWQPVAEASAPKTTADRTAYSRIAFATPKRGMIAGRSSPRTADDGRDRTAAWLDPNPQQNRAQKPALTILFETADGGETWEHKLVSIYGFISRIQLGADGRGVALIEFDGIFPHPAEVYELDLRTGASERSLAQAGFAITDVALVPGGPAYAAGYEAPGVTAWSPLPGRVRVLRSTDLKSWTEVDVDYRAVAKRATLAISPAGGMWLACDTGMILQLVNRVDVTPGR